MLVVLEAPQLLAALFVLVVEVEGMPSFHFESFLRSASPCPLSPTAALVFSPVPCGTSSAWVLLVS